MSLTPPPPPLTPPPVFVFEKPIEQSLMVPVNLVSLSCLWPAIYPSLIGRVCSQTERKH